MNAIKKEFLLGHAESPAMTRRATVGAVLEREYSVEDSWSASILGNAELRVLSTPALVEASEPTCKALIGRYTEKNGHSVGVMVDLRHRTPIPAGAPFKVKARRSSAGHDGHEFDVDALGIFEKIGEGKHARFIVKLDRSRKRMRSRAPGHS